MPHLRRRPTVLVPTVAVIQLLFCLLAIADVAEADYKGEIELNSCLNLGTAAAAKLDCMSFVPTNCGVGDCDLLRTDDPLEGRLQACEVRPCKNNAECETYQDGKHFICFCKEPTTGKTCEELSCTNCYRESDLFVYVDMTTSMDYSTAKKHCEDQGQQLFMDMNWAQHGFIYGLLNQLVTDRDAKVGFWMDLLRNSGGDWVYGNGTALASLSPNYQNWASGHPTTGKDCVILSNADSFKWLDVDCTSASAELQLYPICQKIYPDLKW